MSIRSLGVIALITLITGCASKTTSDFQPLFNGKDLSGWTVKSKPADQAYTFFTVDNGSILADSMSVPKHDYIWLVTNNEYSDFVLKLKFQAYRNNPGNSGIQLRSRYDDAAGWLDGPQIDINPPGPWRTGMMWDETRGNQRWLFPDIPQGQWVNEKMAPSNLKFLYSEDTPSWNDLEITAKGPKITATLNGIQITNYDGSKVLSDPIHQQRNVGMKGRIALQIHTGDQLRIRFKEISIRNLAE